MDPTPSPEEAAAIAAAIARFRADTAIPGGAKHGVIGAWHRAALIEGVGGKGTIEDLEVEGGARWLS